MDQADLGAPLRRNPHRRGLLRARSQRPVRAQRDRQVHAGGCHARRPAAAARRHRRPRVRRLACRSGAAGGTDVRDRAAAHLARAQEFRQGDGWLELPGVFARRTHLCAGGQGTGGGRPDSGVAALGPAGAGRQGAHEGLLRVVPRHHAARRSAHRRRRARPQSRRRCRRIGEGKADRGAAGARRRPAVPSGDGAHSAARGRGIHGHRAAQPAARVAMDQPARPASGRRPAPGRDAPPGCRERHGPRPRRPMPSAARRRPRPASTTRGAAAHGSTPPGNGSRPETTPAPKLPARSANETGSGVCIAIWTRPAGNSPPPAKR